MFAEHRATQSEAERRVVTETGHSRRRVRISRLARSGAAMTVPILTFRICLPTNRSFVIGDRA